jgi:ATP synthase protein I
MDERDETDPLRGLGQRIDKARRAQAGRPPEPAGDSGNAGTGAALALGWRIGLELVGAVAVAVFIGWAIDRWLGTRPWGMIGFFFLGVAAGMVNVYRTVSGLGRAVGLGQARPLDKSAAGRNWDDED